MVIKENPNFEEIIKESKEFYRDLKSLLFFRLIRLII